MKYSKDLKSDGGPDRALNLMTGQVAHTHKQVHVYMRYLHEKNYPKIN